MTAQGQGGGQQREEMPHRPQGEEEREVVVVVEREGRGWRALEDWEGLQEGVKVVWVHFTL